MKSLTLKDHIKTEELINANGWYWQHRVKDTTASASMCNPCVALTLVCRQNCLCGLHPLKTQDTPHYLFFVKVYY